MPDSADNKEIDLKNQFYKDALRIACCQFRFEFESCEVSRAEYEEFLQLQPGEISYFIYKNKLLCDDMEQGLGGIPPRTQAHYGWEDNKKGVYFSIRKKYRKKKFKDNDVKYGIHDYDCIISGKGEEYCNDMMPELPLNYSKEKARGIYEQYAKQENGVMDDIGWFEKIHTTAGEEKIGIRFFEYSIVKDAGEDAFVVFSPGKIRLLDIRKSNYEMIKRSAGIQDAGVKDPYSHFFNRISTSLELERINKELRLFFKYGILYDAQSPLYLADDAQVMALKGGGQWGIINYEYAGYYHITENNDLILLDNARFELKTFRNYWPLDIDKQLWDKKIKRFLAKKFNECHYPLSPCFKDPEIDKRKWQIYTADEQVAAPEFHVMFRDEYDHTPDIYITRYTKVSIKNPAEVIEKIERNLLLAFENQVNVLCLPELSLFLPYDLLKKMMESVYYKCIGKNRENISRKKFLFSDIIIFGSTYIKHHRNTHRIINLGVGVNVTFDDTGLIVDKIRLHPFQKHIYSPVEYSRNNVDPGVYTKAGKELFRWFDTHYWNMSIDMLDKNDNDSVNVIRTKAGIDIYPFICADFIASQIYKYDKLLKQYRILATQTRHEGRYALIIIPAYTKAYNEFYHMLQEIAGETKITVFSNNTEIAHEYYEPGESSIWEKFGGSFIYSKDMQKENEKIDLFHFDHLPTMILQEMKKKQCNITPDESTEMIIATLYYKKAGCPCIIEQAGKIPVTAKPFSSIILSGDEK